MRPRLPYALPALTVLALACGGGGGGPEYPAVGAVDGSPDEKVFRPGQVLSYHVTMSQADRDYMEAHGVGEEWLPATVTVRGGGETVDLGQVAFRHKGGVGNLDLCWGPPTIDEDGDPSVITHGEMLSRQRLDEPFCRKISYKLKFNEYVADTRFHGLEKLNLHSGSRDPTMLHDMLAYSLYYDFGVDAPRTAPARVYINGEFMGLFIAVEDVDDRYAKYHYPAAPGGNLYKEVWPNPVARDAMGPDAFTAFVSSRQDEGSDPTDFLDFTEAMRTAIGQQSVEPLAPWIDMDELLRYMAVDRAIKNWDGVTAMYTCPTCSLPGPHNFYWYHDTAADGRFHLVPWDMDNTFQYWDPYVDPHGYGAERPIPNWNVKPRDCSAVMVWGNSWVVPPGCDAVHTLVASTRWARFEALGRQLARGPLRAEVQRNKALLWAGLIEPIVREDPVIDYATWAYERDVLIEDILVRMPEEFEDLLDEGYVVER